MAATQSVPNRTMAGYSVCMQRMPAVCGRARAQTILPCQADVKVRIARFRLSSAFALCHAFHSVEMLNGQ